MKPNRYFFFNNFFGCFFFKVLGKVYLVNQKNNNKYKCLYDNTHAIDFYNLHSKSSLLAEKYYQKIHGEKKNKYRNSYLKKYAQKILQILVIDNFLNKNFNIQYKSNLTNFYAYEKNISFKIINDLDKFSLLKLNFKIHFLTKIYLIIIDFIKKLYFFISFFYLEYSLFQKFFSKKKIKKSNFLSIYFLEPNQLFSDASVNPDFIFEKSIITKDQIIFICDTNDKEWFSKLKKKNYNLINLAKVSHELNFKDLLSQYLKFFLKRFKYLSKIEFIKLFIFEYKFSLLCKVIEFDFILSSMIVNREIAALKEEYNKKNIFLYFSCHLSPCSIPHENIHTPIDYTFLDLDYLLCTRNMFDFFKNRLNQIKVFKQIALLSTINVNKEDTFKLNNILKNQTDKKIISVFDNSVGPHTWYNDEDYLNLISFIEKISLNTNYKIIFKTKTNLDVFKKKNFNHNLYLKLKELLNNKNILYANDYDFNTISIIKSSDICIACPFSTVIFECTYFDKPTFGFDPSLRLKEISEKLHLSYLRNIDDFNKNVLEKKYYPNKVNKITNELIGSKNYKIENLISDIKDIIKN